MADRFVPVSQMQGGALPTQGVAGAPGLSAEQILGLLKGGVSLAGTAGRFLNVPGAGYSGSVAAPLGLAAGIASGDPNQIAQGGLNTGLEGVKLADKLGYFGSGAAGLAPEFSIGAEALASGLGTGGLLGAEAAGLGSLGADALAGGLGAGGLFAAEAAPTAAALGAEALGAGLGAGGLAGSGAAAGGAATGAAAAGTGLSAALGAAAIPLFFIALGLGNVMNKKQQRIINQTQESVAIRQGAKQGLETLGQTQRFLPGLDKIPPDQLPAVLEQYRGGLAQWPGVQQLLATRGQGGAVSKTKPVDDQTLANVTQAFYPALRDTQAGYLWALDAAARTGQPLPPWLQSFGQSDPAALLNNLSHGYMGAQQMLQPSQVDYSQAVPGNLVNFFQQQTAGDPKLAQLFGGLPALPGQAPTPQAMQEQAAQRQQLAQSVEQQASANQGGLNTGGKGIEALAYTAPYTGGLQQSLTEAFGANAQEQATIADMLSRGADPVGIRSQILAMREQGQMGGGG